jgi:hypothetical protein
MAVGQSHRFHLTSFDMSIANGDSTRVRSWSQEKWLVVRRNDMNVAVRCYNPHRGERIDVAST